MCRVQATGSNPSLRGRLRQGHAGRGNVRGENVALDFGVMAVRMAFGPDLPWPRTWGTERHGNLMDNGTTQQRGRRIKSSILITFSAVVLFVVGAFLFTVYYIERHARETDLNESAEAVSKLLEQKIEQRALAMHAVVIGLTSNRETEAALTARDRTALIRIMQPLYESLRSMHQMTHLYFTDPNLVNLVRLHEPEQHGDTINRYTMLRARDRAETVSGLELGPLGTLTFRMVTPWRRGKEVLGYVELGQEIEQLLDDTSTTLGVELLAYVSKRFLSRAQWESGLRLQQRAGDWDASASHALVAQTADVITPALMPQITRILAGASSRQVAEQGRSLYLAGVPLNNAAGEEIGRLVLVRDVTRLDSAVERSLWLATLVSVVAGFVVFVFFRNALLHVERDYARQHELERQLLRMSGEHQRMVQVEKLSAIGTMIGEIAHQLNNPLVGVVNMAQLAERAADDPPRVRRLLAEIRHAGQDCSAFVTRMLGFTKVSRFQRQMTDAVALINEAVALFRQSGGRRVEVVLQLPEQASFEVDPVLLRHALFNLLVNAGQALGGQGQVSVSLTPQPSSQDGTPGWLLTVEDDGPGFSPEVQAHLFEPFFTTRAEGTGLGLPVVHHVALVHNGWVEATNHSGGGARFALWLPEIEEGHAIET